MVSLAQLRDARFNALDGAAGDWTAFARDLDTAGPRAAVGIAGVLLGSGWAGADADAAYTVLDRQDTELRLAAQDACGVAPLLDAAVVELRCAQRMLVGLLAEASRYGLTVHDSGAVSPSPAAEATQEVKAAELATAIGGVLVRAAEADALLGDGVRQLAPDVVRAGMDRWADAVEDGRMVAALASIDPVDIPAAGGDPRAVRGWWDGLGEEQRQRYAMAFPELLGGLDGLPVHVRDRANRIVLGATAHRLRDELAAEEARSVALGGANGGDGGEVRAAELRRRIAAVDGLRGQVELNTERSGGALAYLLGFSAEGDGRAVVAMGEPDAVRPAVAPVVGSMSEDKPSEARRGRTAFTTTGHVPTAVGRGDGSVVAGETVRGNAEMRADGIVGGLVVTGAYADQAGSDPGETHSGMVPRTGGMASMPLTGVSPGEREFGASRVASYRQGDYWDAENPDGPARQAVIGTERSTTRSS